MTGRALVIGILCSVVGFVWLPLRVDAQPLDDEEDMSTGEISEVSDANSVLDESASDDDLSDDSPSENTGNHGSPRPQTPLQPNR